VISYYDGYGWVISEPYHRRDEVRVWREPWPFAWTPPAPARYKPADQVEDLPIVHPLLRITATVLTRWPR
jgi:hypothetical protein